MKPHPLLGQESAGSRYLELKTAELTKTIARISLFLLHKYHLQAHNNNQSFYDSRELDIPSFDNLLQDYYHRQCGQLSKSRGRKGEKEKERVKISSETEFR